MFEVVGIGECVVDMVGYVANLPKLDTKTYLTSFQRFVGGSVPTALIILSRLGVKTTIIGAITHDEHGKFFISELEKEGVVTDHLQITPNSRTPLHFVLVSRRPQVRTILKNRRELPDLRLSKRHKKVIGNSKILLLDRHTDKAGIEAAKFAKKNGTMVIFDPSNRFNSHIQDLLTISDVVIAPREFANYFYVGPDLKKAISAIWKINGGTVVLTLGGRGCIAVTKDGIVRVPAYKKKRVIDTNGAGDVFHGAFTYGLLQEWGIERICQFANKQAALKISRLGK